MSHVNRAIGLLIVFWLAACQTAASPSAIATPHGSDPGGPGQSTSDSGRIVFGRYYPDTDQWLIFTMRPNGSDERRLALPGSNGGPRWSPDGTKLIAYATSPQGLLFAGVANADGSGWRILNSPDRTLNLGCAAWSPDGTRLACEGWDDGAPTRNGLYTVRASDGGDLVRLSTAPAGFHDIPSDYDPDGTRILFGRAPLEEGTAGKSFSIRVDGTELEELPAAWAAGRFRPAAFGILASRAGKLVVLDPSGGNPIPIPIANAGAFDYGAAWSPDGTQIVFSAIGAGETAADLYTVNRDGTELTQLTSTPFAEEFADWSR